MQHRGFRSGKSAPIRFWPHSIVPHSEDFFVMCRRWIQQWTELVPILMSMKSDCDSCEKENESPTADGDNEPPPSYLNERGEDYQEQIGMPDEQNMRSWSHHHSTDTVDDPIFRAAMRGYDAVSFVFGLEVTWSLIQHRQQEEEERQALLELETMNEMNAASNETDDAIMMDDDECEDDQEDRAQEDDAFPEKGLDNSDSESAEDQIVEDSTDVAEHESSSLAVDTEEAAAMLEGKGANNEQVDDTESQDIEDRTEDEESTKHVPNPSTATTADPVTKSSKWECEVSLIW